MTILKLKQQKIQNQAIQFFFNTVSDGDLCDHSGIYLGDLEFIHASSAKGEVVISKIEDNYYAERFSWGRRILSD